MSLPVLEPPSWVRVYRISCSCRKGKLKCEAAASSVEERLKDKQALEAEAMAAKAKVSENNAMVSAPCNL